MTSTRQLSAIMFTDIVGYTDMMQRDEPSMPSFVMSPLDVYKRQMDAFY